KKARNCGPSSCGQGAAWAARAGGGCVARRGSHQVLAGALGIAHVAGQADAEQGQDKGGQDGPDKYVGSQSETGHGAFSFSSWVLDSGCAVWKATTCSPIRSKSKRSWLRRLTATQTSMLTP